VAGKKAVADMAFMTDYSAITSALRAVDEMVRASSADGGFALGAVPDLATALARARAEGAFLSADDFLLVAKSLTTASEVYRFFAGESTDDDSYVVAYPELHAQSVLINPLPMLAREIDKIIDQYGNVKDNASPKLAEIRAELSKISGTANAILRRVMAKAVAEGLLEADASPSVRDGRLVIPVPPMNKRRIQGIVHDQSASGKTYFIEPSEVVEVNNRQRQLQLDEQREIVRILTALTSVLRPEIPTLLGNSEILGWFDFVVAKAKYAVETGGMLPQIAEGRELDWYHAVHPVLLLSLQSKGKEIVPLDIRLTPQARILVISGPNAGGKSVCLKTVGIIQYMMQSGVLPPLYENSRMGIFDDIFIDIGDDQSILDDLSTYSSHLRNMRLFLRNGRKSSLMLIDEFGAGTEPQIGGAMAQAILKSLNGLKMWGVVTTHFQNLKLYAKDTPGLINGSMLYDRQHLRPLFKLAIGSPGSSFALEIARTAGLPKEVIDDAREIAGSDYVNMDKYLLDIARDRRYWENKRLDIKRKEKQLDQTLTTYGEDAATLRAHRKEILAEAREEAKKIIESSNASIERAIREIREAQADKERTRQARQQLVKDRQQLAESLESGKDNNEHALLKKAPKPKHQQPKPIQQKSEAPLQIGDFVKLDGGGTVGTILEIAGNNAVCSFGMLKTTVKLQRLSRSLARPASGAKSASFLSRTTTDNLRDRQLSFKPEIDVRGMRADEALQAVTYFIDDAIQFQQTPVRILHGTGTGALRQALRQYLDTIPGVASYTDEDVRFGGAGITVVTLR
jgi:DNA mismatch repair protein MutS2